MPLATSQSDAASVQSDESLLAEVAPAMLFKLKTDSRQQARSSGLVFVFIGGFMLPNLYRQIGPERVEFPPAHLADWIGLLFVLSIFVLLIYGLVAMIWSFIGRPSMVREELRYRRQHGKWRWER